MKNILQKIPSILGGRVARNVYFWALVISSRFFYDDTKEQVIFAGILFALLMILSYGNTLFLAPRFLGKGKNRTYVLLAVALTFSVAFLYVLTLKIMLHYYPGYQVSTVSIITGPKNTGVLSFSSIISEMNTYFPGMLVWTAVFTMAWYGMNFAKTQQAAENAKKQQVETELRFLKGQINPHFLFNTLNNLYGLSIKKADTAPDAILKLSSILRYLLYESNTDLVAFSKEKEVMLAYIDLELLRLSKNDNLSFSITSDTSCNIPPLLWLPVLENVFKHGTRFIDDNYMIDYRFSIQNNKLTIYSKNDYNPSGGNHSLEKNAGIGLGNLKQRLDILYPGKYSLETGSQPGADNQNEYYIAKVEIMLN
jgi:sensor histidine kinase YesM